MDRDDRPWSLASDDATLADVAIEEGMEARRTTADGSRGAASHTGQTLAALVIAAAASIAIVATAWMPWLKGPLTAASTGENEKVVVNGFEASRRGPAGPPITALTPGGERRVLAPEPGPAFGECRWNRWYGWSCGRHDVMGTLLFTGESAVIFGVAGASLAASGALAARRRSIRVARGSATATMILSALSGAAAIFTTIGMRFHNALSVANSIVPMVGPFVWLAFAALATASAAWARATLSAKPMRSMVASLAITTFVVGVVVVATKVVMGLASGNPGD